MVADLHLHYPLHLVPERPRLGDLLRSRHARRVYLERLDSRFIAAWGRLWNYRSFRSGPAATIDAMRRGRVSVALSVLMLPLLEAGERATLWYSRRPPYGAPPKDWYFEALLRQLELVEREVAGSHADDALVAHDLAELDRALAEGKLALVHAVEGGYHLGASPETVDAAVTELASRGVAYITLAHLYWRHVATNEPATPWISDRTYHRIFPQPDVGLTELGRAAVRAMVRERVLIDITHMSARAVDDTLTLLDDLDPERETPVLVSHGAFRFGTRTYNITRSTIERVAARGGLIGLIFSDSFISDGFHKRPTTFEEAFVHFAKHIEKIHEITGSHEHTAIGSDLDGFIKPTLPGFADLGEIPRLELALRDRFGAKAADAIANGNVLRLLRRHWGHRPSTVEAIAPGGFEPPTSPL